MKTLKVRLTGLQPLVMHNGLLADPTYPLSVEIAKINKKRKKELVDHEERNRLEWEGSLYWDEDEGPVIPCDNIERCIQAGGQKTRRGKDIAAAVWVEGGAPVKLNYDGPRDKDKLYAQDGKFALRKGVVVQRNRIMRVRPMFPRGNSNSRIEEVEVKAA